MTQTILVCGGAGYIGAHMCEQLAERDYRVVVFDNLSSGHCELRRRASVNPQSMRRESKYDYVTLVCAGDSLARN